MNIKREQYLNELIDRKHNTLIKIITGIRRCGKSYLLNTIFYDHLIKSGIKQDHIIKFAFDSANDLSLINEDLIELSLNNRKVDPKKFINYIWLYITTELIEPLSITSKTIPSNI